MKTAILSIVLTVVTAVGAAAQRIPDDPAFRCGKLPNGMSYYLYHNENPAGCAEFYIAHNVGALQEEDSQNGLAHFLEHMAFNGTKHYPGKGVLEFLARDGVRFGYNVNAYTSRTETVYNISQVPLRRESFVDSVLTVLRDWSCDISCEQEALDDERGVISEEWRLRDEPRYRMNCRQNELVYKGGKQPLRTVLGTMEVINGFKREDILDFYHKWYRPDLQAVIVVGDFDVDDMEKRVREKFSDVPMPSDPPQKASSYLPPRQDGPMFADQTDPTIKYKAYKIICKQPYPELSSHRTEEFYRDRFARQIISCVLSDRLRLRSREKDCPYNSAVLVTAEEEPWFYVSMFTVTPRKDDDLASAVRPVLEEIERMVRYGISREEFEASKLGAAQKAHIDRDLYPEDVRNADVVRRCTESFLRDYPLVAPVEWQEMQRRALADVTYEDVAPYPVRMFVESERIYSNCYNVKEPRYAVSADTVKAMMAEIAASDIAPKHIAYPELDLSVKSAPGAITERKSLAHGVELWTLSNGAKVWYSQCVPVRSGTHLSMDICFDTGYRVFPQDNIPAGLVSAAYYKRYAGLRGIDRTNLKNYPQLAGISTIISSGVGKSYIQVNAPADKIDAAFRMANLQLTEPFFISAKHFDKTREETLKNLGKPKTPRDRYREKVDRALYGDNPWSAQIDSAGVQAATFEMMRRQYRAEFGDFSNMKVYVCSDAPREQIEDCVCRCLASLKEESPVTKAEDRPLWQAYRGRTELFEEQKPLSAPMCDVSCRFSAGMRKDTRMREAAKILDHILSARYLNLIREERGGTYHVSFATEVFDNPSRPVQAEVAFQTRPELRDVLLKDVEDVMADISRHGPTGKEMSDAKKFFLKYEGERRVRNANSTFRQMQQMEEWAINGKEYDFDYEAVMSSIDASYIRRLARRLASGDRLIAVYTER